MTWNLNSKRLLDEYQITFYRIISGRSLSSQDTFNIQKNNFIKQYKVIFLVI